MRCKDCGGEIHLWGGGKLRHWEWGVDHDHEPRIDDGLPNDTVDLFKQKP